MRFGVLGVLEVAVGDQPVPIGSHMQRRLLALLLLHANEVVATDRIIDVLWRGEPPVAAQAGLHSYVSRLRRALGDAGEAERIQARPPGYRLRAGPDEVDAHRFEQQVETTHSSPATTPAETAARLSVALGCWRGPAYAEFADEDFARGEAVRLNELRLAVTEDCFDARLAARAHGELVGELEAFTTQHPFRERPRGQLMLALHRCGRQPEGLEAFQRFRELLGDELGLEPSPQLRQLHDQILRREPALIPAPQQPAAPPADVSSLPDASAASSPAVPGNLPREVTSFVGRRNETEAVARLLDRGPLVTLTGPGGVGKTRLALRAAAHAAGSHPDGVWLCELAPVDANAVDHAVAGALGVVPEGGVVDALVAFLTGRRALVVLDNCEHVVDAVAGVVERLIRSCENVTVLATSRQPLGVRGEQAWSVPPLPVPGEGPDPEDLKSPSLALFCDRAALHRPGFALTSANAAAVVAICRQLDGLPLAIELAAALLHAMEPEEIAVRLDQRLSLLTHGRRTDPRHRSLSAVVDWSYQLLEQPVRHLFDRLAVFSGTFGLDAVETVCADEQVPRERIAGLLAELVGASMVDVERAGGATRYRLLETLRQYGLDRLTERGEEAALRARHTAHFVAAAERADAAVREADEASGVAAFEADMDNLRAVHRWTVDHGETDLALRLVTACYAFALYRLHDEVFRWAEELVDTLDVTAHPLGPAVHGVAAHGISHRGDLARTKALARRGLDAAADVDDPARLPALTALAAVALYEGRLGECRRLAEETGSLAHRWQRHYEAAVARQHEVLALAYSGEQDAALRVAADHRQRPEGLKSPIQRGWALYCNAEALGDTDPTQALALLEKAMALADSVRGRFLTGVALVSATSLRARHGSPVEALASFREVIGHWRRTGDWIHQWTTLRNLVTLLIRLDEHEPAAVLLGALTAAETAAPLYGADAQRLADAAETLTRHLGEEAFAVSRKRGAAMEALEVVDFAVATITRL